MTEETIKLQIQLDDAVKEIGKLSDQMEDFKNETLESQKAIQDIGKTGNKRLSGIGNAINKVGKGFKGAGLAVKAFVAGLGLKLFEKFTEILMQNQTIVDGLSVAFGTVSTVFTKFIDGIISAGNEFTSLGDILKNSVMVPINLFKTAIFGIQTGLLRAQLAWEKSFLGGQDADKIKKLEEDINRVDQKVGDAAGGLVDNVVGIGKGFVQTGKELGDFTSKAIENTKKISITQEAANQERIQQLRNETEIALAENDKLQFQFQLQAERQRQIRDDVTASIDDRIAANDKLKGVLEEQFELQLANAQKAIDLAEAELAANPKLVANKTALIEAEKNLADVKENIAGFESEQRVNAEGLELEAIDLVNSRKEAENARAIAKKQAIAEEIEDEVLRLQRLKEISIEEQKQEEERLKNQIKLLGEGTQAKQDAEQQLLDFTQEKQLEQRQFDLDIEAQEKENKLQKAEEDKKIEEDKRNQRLQTLATIEMIAGKESAIGKAAFLARQAMLIKEQIMEAKATLQKMGLLAAESSADIAAGTAKTAKIGFPQNVPMLIAFAAQAVGIIASVKSAVNAVKSKAASMGGAGGGGSDAAPPRQVPAFNIVGANTENQLANAIGENEQRPIKAFVTSGDVTTQQSLDRNIVENASI